VVVVVLVLLIVLISRFKLRRPDFAGFAVRARARGGVKKRKSVNKLANRKRGEPAKEDNFFALSAFAQRKIRTHHQDLPRTTCTTGYGELRPTAA
jgi:hypothetical protein